MNPIKAWNAWLALPVEDGPMRLSSPIRGFWQFQVNDHRAKLHKSRRAGAEGREQFDATVCHFAGTAPVPPQSAELPPPPLPEKCGAVAPARMQDLFLKLDESVSLFSSREFDG